MKQHLNDLTIKRLSTYLIQLDYEDTTVNHSRKDLDWMWECLALVIDWLITGTVYQPNSGIINTFKKHVSVKLDPETVN